MKGRDTRTRSAKRDVLRQRRQKDDSFGTLWRGDAPATLLTSKGTSTRFTRTVSQGRVFYREPNPVGTVDPRQSRSLETSRTKKVL